MIANACQAVKPTEISMSRPPTSVVPPAAYQSRNITTSSATPPAAAISSPGRRRLSSTPPPPAAAAAACAASSVLRSSIAIVIGPTPPGTGVISPARSAAGVEVDVADQAVVGAVDADVDHRRRRA